MVFKDGHGESTFVPNLGLSGAKDWRLIEDVVISDFSLVQLYLSDRTLRLLTVLA